jgi:hypothetical protein
MASAISYYCFPRAPPFCTVITDALPPIRLFKSSELLPQENDCPPFLPPNFGVTPELVDDDYRFGGSPEVDSGFPFLIIASTSLLRIS